METSAFISNDTISRTDRFTVFAREVKEYLFHCRQNRRQVAEETGKRETVVDDHELAYYFREREREINSELIMQYLISFSEYLPDPIREHWEGVDPYLQFRCLVGFEIELIVESDVLEMIIEEYRCLGRFSLEQLGRFQERILEKHGDLSAWFARTADLGYRDSLESQLRILQQLCLFWFQIKQENPRSFRKNDIYIFNLAARVLYRYYFKPMSMPPLRTR